MKKDEKKITQKETDTDKEKKIARKRSKDSQ